MSYLMMFILIFSILGAVDHIFGNRFGLGKEFEKALMLPLSQFLKFPLKIIGKRSGINKFSVVGVISSLASSATSFGMMDKMDSKGVVINSAFAVSVAFIVGSHLAFTMAFDNSYVIPVITEKLISGICSIILAIIIFNITNRKEDIK